MMANPGDKYIYNPGNKVWTFSISFLFMWIIGLTLISMVIGAAIAKHGFKEREKQFNQMARNYQHDQDYIKKLEKDIIFISGELRTTDDFIFEHCQIK